jgi:hypothetical protein
MVDPHDMSGADDPLQFGVFSASAGRYREFKEFATVALDSFEHGPERGKGRTK